MASKSNWGPAPYQVVCADGTETQITVSGRNKWALDMLILAGRRGCTPIDNPAPRWSAHAFNLRQLGIAIETITEAHGGPFSGTHARYVLRASVSCAKAVFS